MINILLGITAIVGNTAILIVLHKQTSLNQPSKVFLRNPVASDLCVGFVQLLFGAHGISILKRQWQICHLLYFFTRISGTISVAVSLWTITVISVDRLMALFLKFRYRQFIYFVGLGLGLGFPLVFQSQCNESTLYANHLHPSTVTPGFFSDCVTNTTKSQIFKK